MSLKITRTNTLIDMCVCVVSPHFRSLSFRNKSLVSNIILYTMSNIFPLLDLRGENVCEIVKSAPYMEAIPNCPFVRLSVIKYQLLNHW
jgi:hypothetical protein